MNLFFKLGWTIPNPMTRVRETNVFESYRGYLFINDKRYARNVLSVPVNLKTRLS